MGEIDAGERPAAQLLLGMLVDIHNHDPRIGSDAAAKLKSGVEGVEFQAVDGIECRHRPFAHEGRKIHAKRKHHYGETDTQ